MGLVTWVKSFFGSKNTISLTENYLTLSVEYHFKMLALETCIDLLANAIVLCEFQTFQKGKEHRGENYYLLNVSPNQNQNASEFYKKLISKMLKEKEVLVIMRDKQLYIADSFNKTEYAFNENVYSEIQVNNLLMNKTYKESDVLYFQYQDQNVKNILEGLFESYGKLLTSAMNIYKRSNAKKLVLQGDFLRPQTLEEQEQMEDLFNTQFKNWLEADKAGSVLPLQKNFNLVDMSGAGKNGTAGVALTSRDIRALVDDVFDFYSMAFHIPRGLLKGDMADIEKQMDSLIMLGVKPLAEILTDEYNRKVYKKEGFLERSYAKLDASRIKVSDIAQIATAADKFFAIGVNSINDNLRMLGREPIDEEWANKRFVTKNYSLVENIENIEGGENNGNNITEN